MELPFNRRLMEAGDDIPGLLALESDPDLHRKLRRRRPRWFIDGKPPACNSSHLMEATFGLCKVMETVVDIHQVDRAIAKG